MPWLLVRSHSAGTFVWDFQQELWPGGRDVLHGVNPYPPLSELGTGTNFVFPAPVGLAMAPLALLPLAVAEVVWALVLIAAGLGTIRVLGVRDWRVYGAAFLWTPVYVAVQNGNLTLLLALGTAVAWRYRDRAWICGASVACLIAAKLFLWPLLIWLLATRRFRAAAVAFATALALLGVSFAVVGGLGHYADVLRELGRLFDDKSYTPFALGLELGLSAEVSHLVGYALAALALIAAAGRRSLVLALTASLLLSPIVWMHYYALLVVPLAIRSPRFTPLWLLPAVTWLCPSEFNGEPWQTALMLGVAAVVVYVSVEGRHAATLLDRRLGLSSA